MKLFAFIASILLTASLSFATSLHPCTPSVQAMPMHLFCHDPVTHNRYSVKIDTVMSPPLSMCQGKNRYEYKTATVFSGPIGGQFNEFYTIQDGDFTFSLGGPTGKAFFISPKHGLDLNECVTPMHSGFSVGN